MLKVLDGDLKWKSKLMEIKSQGLFRDAALLGIDEWPKK